jgi:transcriptional regulator with XRE-family HTH domain
VGASAKSAPEPLLRFCARLKRLQEASGLPQKTLARELHLSEQQMSGILTGKIRRIPPWERVQAIVDVCYRAADTRSLPPDLADRQAWRGRYTDVERDLEAAVGTPGLGPLQPRQLHLAGRRAWTSNLDTDPARRRNVGQARHGGAMGVVSPPMRERRLQGWALSRPAGVRFHPARASTLRGFEATDAGCGGFGGSPPDRHRSPRGRRRRRRSSSSM